MYRQVFVRDVESGMVLGKDVLSKNGEILLAKGIEITSAVTIRRLLNQHGVALITVEKEKTLPAIEEITYERQVIDPLEGIEDQEVIRVINEITENREVIKESFDKFVRGEKVEKKDIEKRIEDTLEVFKKSANIFQIMQNVKYLDDITYSHCHNVSLISYTIGRWLDLKENDLRDLALAGMLIDIGKVQIDQKLLNKKGQLTEDELWDLRNHSILSHEIIKDYDFISERVKRAVLLHHERMDGSGYPLGIKGDEIPLFARIIAVADVYNALTSDRPYRDKKTPFAAIKILETEYMGKLDTSILYLFLRRIASNYIGQRILLNNEQRGEIIFIPQHNIYRPIIKIQDSQEVIDLSEKQNMHLDIVEFY